MLSVYVPHGTTLERIVVEPGLPPPDNAIWIDMVTPTVHEDKLVEQMLGIAVPTREEMQEIEVSSRLYVENGARYSRGPDWHPYVVTEGSLVTGQNPASSAPAAEEVLRLLGARR